MLSYCQPTRTHNTLKFPSRAPKYKYRASFPGYPSALCPPCLGPAVTCSAWILEHSTTWLRQESLLVSNCSSSSWNASLFPLFQPVTPPHINKAHKTPRGQAFHVLSSYRPLLLNLTGLKCFWGSPLPGCASPDVEYSLHRDQSKVI